MTLSRDEILALRRDPPTAGQTASRRRAALFGATIEIRPMGPLTERERASAASVVRGPTTTTAARWPDPSTLHDGDTVVIQLDPDQASAEAWVDWLDRLANRETPLIQLTVAPFTSEPAGTFRLWALAAARIQSPAWVRVAARHDLVGIRLAQLAVGFGADTLAGPIESDRKLPLAGVTRPDERTRAGLVALVVAAGLEARVDDAAADGVRARSRDRGPATTPTSTPVPHEVQP